MTLLRKALLALAVLIAPALLAQSADLRIASVLPSGTPTLTGERFAITVRWRNDGPNAASFVHLSVTGAPKPHYILSVATSGWPCYPDPEGTTYLCQNATLAPGAEAELVLQLLTPPTAGPFSLTVRTSAAEHDPNPANNTVTLTFNIAAAPAADLSISPTSQLYRVGANAPVTFPIDVRNAGPNPIQNLYAVITVPVTANLPSFTASGAGWSCAHPAYGAQAVICTRPRLNAGESAPLEVRTNAANPSGTHTYSIRVRGEGHSDPIVGNELATVTVTTEQEQATETWTRILVPLTGGEVPGSNNARWRTETTALISSETQIGIEPNACRFQSVPCDPVPLPLNRPFDARGTLVGFGDSPNGQFLFVREEHEPRLHLNSRVYDASRTEQTAGAEIPIVRESRFINAPVSIVGIPVAPHYRHTVRVYDLDGRNGAQVSIRVYANDELTPRVAVVRALAVPAGAVPVLAQQYSSHPGYLQAELGQLLTLAGIDTVRVEITPLDPAVRLWSFVSVTNNETHHVTTFSQR